MSSRCRLALLLACLLGLFAIKKSAAQKLSPPKTEIIEFVNDYDAYSNRSNEVTVFPNKPPNSQLVIGEDTSVGSRILLKCTADFPVQWIYLGDGQPEFTTYTNVEWMGETGRPLRFSAEASLGLLGFQRTLRETDTGNYTCRSTQNPKVLSFYYIYVPGPELFTRKGGENITYSYKDTTIRIPCSISSPSTAVTLCKFTQNGLQCPVKDARYKYDSKRGFLLNLWELPNPSGTYVCAGSNKKLYKVAEYTLVPTSQPISKDPCASSPCGYQAECSANSDGTAICYCFRGYNGNPYDQCKDGPVEGSKCYGNDDCPLSKSCLLGKCVDPCDPSPCGSESVCEVYGRKARCSCRKGFDGKPPYCKKTCTDNFDCGRNEICSRKSCTAACPGPCAVNADCRVAQRGAQRNTVCSCPPGFSGDPTKRCRAISGSTSIPPWKGCPNGYIGKPPYCEPVECDVDEDCPPEKECVSNICQRQDSPPSLSCGGQCGLNAECKLPLFGKEPACECLKGYKGDPEIFCSADTDSSSSSDNTKPPWQSNPCKPNPCADYGDCRVVNGKAKCKGEVSPAKCPKGFIGKPPKCRPDDDFGEESVECEYDFECPLGSECVNDKCTKESKDSSGNGGGKDEDECEGSCGTNAECKMTNLSAEYEYDCFCKPGFKGNPFLSCKKTGDSSTTSSPCDSSPCAHLAACRVINGQAVCKCPRGYRGDPYVDCRSSYQSTTESSLGRNPYRTTTDSPLDRNSYTTTRRGSRRDECELEDDSLPYSFAYRIGSGSCGSNEKCESVNGVRKCVCKAGYSGKPPNCEKYSQGNSRCVDDEDCAEDESCQNFSCASPCSREPKYPCAPNAECRVVDKNPLCSCARGYVGDPRHRCRPSGRRQSPYASGSSTSNRNLDCNTSSLNCRGSNTEASCVDGEPLCVCKKGYVGYPPNCRLECEKNSHCYKSKVCVRNQCVDPCENANACSAQDKCTVLNHVLTCIPKAATSNNNPCLNGYRSSRCRYE